MNLEKFKKAKTCILGQLATMMILVMGTFIVFDNCERSNNFLVCAKGLHEKTGNKKNEKVLTAKMVKKLSVRKDVVPNGCFDVFIVPNEFVKIGPGAFKRTFFREIRLSSNIEDIGDKSFKKCPNLERVEIPEKCTTIGKECFKYCTNLKDVIFLTDNDGFCKLNSIGEETFANCLALEEISVPSSCKKVGNRCFEGCRNLSKVFLLDTENETESPLEIGDKAFLGCTSLEDIAIPSNCKYMGTNCFDTCIKLKSVFCLKI